MMACSLEMRVGCLRWLDKVCVARALFELAFSYLMRKCLIIPPRLLSEAFLELKSESCWLSSSLISSRRLDLIIDCVDSSFT